MGWIATSRYDLAIDGRYVCDFDRSRKLRDVRHGDDSWRAPDGGRTRKSWPGRHASRCTIARTQSRPIVTYLRSFAAFVAITTSLFATGCSKSAVTPHFELGSDEESISYVNSDHAKRFTLRACKGTTLSRYWYPKGRLSPNGTWFVFEAQAPYADQTTWFVSTNGLAVTATDFPRAFHFPVPAILSYNVWTDPGGQRMRYEFNDGVKWHFIEPLIPDRPRSAIVHSCLFAESRNPDKPSSKYGIPDAPKNHRHR